MSSIRENLKQQFNSGSMVIKLIMVNVGFFVVSLLVSICIKFGIPSFAITNYIGVSSNFTELLLKPWTLVTFMFSHSLSGIGHLFWNMIMLYFAGTYFVNKLGSKKLLSLYLAGGFTGFLFFAFGYNFLPVFSGLADSVLVGASASVTAILVVIGVLYPNDEIRIMFVPKGIKLIYIVGFLILMDIINLQASMGVVDSNQGGWLSHIGGAIFGFFYATRIRQGKNVLKGFESFLDSIFSLSFMNIFFKNKKPKFKVEKGGNQRKKESNTSKKSNSNISSILEKVKNSGYESLTKNEKDRLFSQSKK